MTFPKRFDLPVMGTEERFAVHMILKLGLEGKGFVCLFPDAILGVEWG